MEQDDLKQLFSKVISLMTNSGLLRDNKIFTGKNLIDSIMMKSNVNNVKAIEIANKFAERFLLAH